MTELSRFLLVTDIFAQIFTAVVTYEMVMLTIYQNFWLGYIIGLWGIGVIVFFGYLSLERKR